MKFSDEDKAEFPEVIKENHPIKEYSEYLKALLSRLEASERKNKADDAYADFDCPHESEDFCKCGLVQLELIKKCEEADEAWRKSKGL